MPAFEPAARYAGPRAGMIFTTRDGRTGYYADAAAQSSRCRDDASSSADARSARRRSRRPAAAPSEAARLLVAAPVSVLAERRRLGQKLLLRSVGASPNLAYRPTLAYAAAY